MERIAEVYARALFEAALNGDALDAVREQLAQFAQALSEDRDLALFFFSPYFSSEEKEDGLRRAVSDAHPIFLNFLLMLIERHRMPAIFAVTTRFQHLWGQEMKLLPVEVTSAIDLDPATVSSIGEQIGAQTGRKVQLSSRVDPDILGGIVLRVGNFVLDASIRNQLGQLRKQVARA
ncbi:MAG: ATP synthase F1 subunit delta [Solirubrobacteraceae bacterium]